MGEILAKDIYFDAVSIVSFKEPRLQKVVKGLNETKEKTSDAFWELFSAMSSFFRDG